jgi:hypothetical protein
MYGSSRFHLSARPETVCASFVDPAKIMSVFRIADGKIAEHWGENDGMGLLMQLGVLPTPGQ